MGLGSKVFKKYRSLQVRRLIKKGKNNIKQDYELKKYLLKNKKFKNCHKGERCFIVGNGPSLNDEDLSSLSNEIVFTVNKIANHPQFDSIKTNYHFWADPSFFKLSPDKEEDRELIKQMFSVKTSSNNPICFFPEFSRNCIKAFNVEENLDVYIYYANIPFNDGENSEIDFANVTFGFQTVVQFAIAMAIYMGFKEIYLLGCDTTGIISTIQACLNEEVTHYSYSVSDSEKKFLKNMAESRDFGIESDFLGWARILHLYRELYRYCNNRDIKLINCSSKTIIDSIPRASLKDVLNEKVDSQ